MERRKSKICMQFVEIKEEKTTLQENLAKIMKQVFSCVDHISTFSGEIKQKDLGLILKHELDVLKKLTEINCELEDIIEQNPLKQLKITEKENEDDNRILECTGNTLEQYRIFEKMCERNNEVPESSEIDNETISPVEITNQTGGNSSENELCIIKCPSDHISELISGSHNIETQSNFSDSDIQYLRDTLKKFSEKLGLNAESISSMKDYYEKSSTSCKKEIFDPPSRTDTPPYNCTHPKVPMSSDCEIPEKDTNVPISLISDLKENFTNIFSAIEAEKINSEMSESNSTEFCPDINNLTESVAQNNAYYPDISSLSTETEIPMSSHRNDCSEDSARKEHSHCPSNSSNLNDSPIPSTINNDEKTDVSTDEQRKTVYSALEKLNNKKFDDSKKPILNKIIQQQIPDLKLRPTQSQVIKNDFEVNGKLKKRKNKKSSTENDGVLYELTPKSSPKVGMECAFSHVESPTEFYIHIVDEESTCIDGLTEQINEQFENTLSDYDSKEEACTYIGTYCFAFISEYNGWYRAQILDWYLDNISDDVLLRLVDYGNKRRVSYKNLRKMDKEMADIHMLAVRCHLPLMYPPHSTPLNRLSEWPPESIDAMVGLSGLCQTETQETKFFKIVYVHEEEESVAIDIYSQQDDAEHTVGQILLDLGLAVQIIDDLDEENLEVEQYLQDVGTFGKADNINEAIIGYDPRDEARICRFTKKDGTCYKGKNCKLEHGPLSRDGFTTDREPVFKEAMYDLLLPANDEVISILITGYKDPCNFFVQIVRNPHKEKNYVLDKDLYVLLENMNYPRTVRTYETFKVPPAIGEIVIVKHWSKKWLRAVVREQIMLDNDEREEYQVFSLDFGDYLQVALSELRKIKPNFLQLPFQAIECYIAKYKAKKDCDERKAREFFNQNLYFRNLVAVAIRSETLPLKVEIKAYNGFDVGKILAENGFAEERTCDKNPADGCLLALY